MAKQELLKSAFDGKLGGWVGSKYYGKPTIRAYTVPRNPKTEKQVEHRQRFFEINYFLTMFANKIGRDTPFYTPKKQILQTLLEKNKTVIAGGQDILGRLRVSSGYLTGYYGMISDYIDNGVKLQMSKKIQRIDLPNMTVCAIVLSAELDKIAYGKINAKDFENGQELIAYGNVGMPGPFGTVYCWTIAKKDNCIIGSDTVYNENFIPNP